MLDIKHLVYATQIHPLTTSFAFTLYDELEGYRVISGGGSVSWTNTGTTPLTRCIYDPVADVLMPGYGPNGEDAWRFSGRWSNSNRTAASITIRAVAVKEIPDTPPEDVEEE